MPRFGEYESLEILAYGPFSAVFSARRRGDETGDAPYVVRVFQSPLGMAADRAALERKAFVDRVQVQRAMLPEAGGPVADRHWVPILQTDDGSADTEAWAVSPRYELHAGQLIDGRARLSEHDLYTVVAGVVRGLRELRDALGRAHGNLGPNNVLLRRPPDGQGWRADLADPIESARLRPHHDEVADLRAVGRLIDGLVTHRRTVDLGVESGALRQRWQALGRRGGRWRDLCETLLDPAAAAEPLDLDGLAARLEALRPVAPQVRRRRVRRWVGGVLAIVAVLIAGVVLRPKSASVQEAREAYEQILCAMPWLQHVSETLDRNELPNTDWTEVADLREEFERVRADLRDDLEEPTDFKAAGIKDVREWREIRKNRKQYLRQVEQLGGGSRDLLIEMRDTIEAIRLHLTQPIHKKLTEPAAEFKDTYGWKELPAALSELAKEANPAPDFDPRPGEGVPEDDERWVGAWAKMEERAKELEALKTTVAQLEKDAEEWAEEILSCWEMVAAEGAPPPDLSSFGRGLVRESSSISETKYELEELMKQVELGRVEVERLRGAFGAVTETKDEEQWQGKVTRLLDSVIKSARGRSGPSDLIKAIGQHVKDCRQMADALIELLPDPVKRFEPLRAAKFESPEVESAYKGILTQRQAEFDFSVSDPASLRQLDDAVRAFVEQEGIPFKQCMMTLDAFLRCEVVSATDEGRFGEVLRQKAGDERERRVNAMLAGLDQGLMSQRDVDALEAEYQSWLAERRSIAGCLAAIETSFDQARGLDDEIDGSRLVDVWEDTIARTSYVDTFAEDDGAKGLMAIVGKLKRIGQEGPKPDDSRDEPAVAWAAWREKCESEERRPADLGQLTVWQEAVKSALARISDEVRREALRKQVDDDLWCSWLRAAGHRVSEDDLDVLDEKRAVCGIDSLQDLDQRLQFDLALYRLGDKVRNGDPAREDLIAALRKFVKATESLADVELSPRQLELVGKLASLRDEPENPPIDWSRYGPGNRGWACTDVGGGVLQFSGQAGGEDFTIAFKHANDVAYVATDEMPVKLALGLGLRGTGGRGAQTWSNDGVAHQWMPTAEAATYPLADPATPEDLSPVQQIGSGDAKDLANELGCRLPTLSEWRSALAQDANGAAPNLRDASFVQFEVRVRSLHSEKPTDNRNYPLPRRGRHDDKEPGADNDGHVWFWPTAPASHDWQNLVGNVAEFVADGGVVKIVGGSAFGGDGSPVDDTRSSYSDVGFRLAFSGPQAPKTLLQKVREAPQDPPYSFSPPRRVDAPLSQRPAASVVIARASRRSARSSCLASA